MKRPCVICSCLLSAALAGVGCGKDDDIVSGSQASAQTSPAPVAVGAATATAPAATLPHASRSATSQPHAAVAGASDIAASAEAVVNPEVARKQSQIDWAIKQNAIKADPNGQWAVQATASSTYGDLQGNANYAAAQATGEPNVEQYGSNALAWAPKTADAGLEWLDLQYAKPVHATAVRVRESHGPGAVIKVEVFDEQGAAHTVWQGNDATKGLDYLQVEFAKTPFKTRRTKLTLATNIVSGWNAIDAVQLVGTEQ